jgi:hypothetical protein
LHHRDVVGYALRRLERELEGELREETIEDLVRDLHADSVIHPPGELAADDDIDKRSVPSGKN